ALPGFISTMNLSASPGRPACPSRVSGVSSCPRLGGSRVGSAFLVYMLSPLPRRSGWTYCFAHSLQPYQPSPKGLSGRPAHRPFRGLLGVHSRYGLHTRAVTVYRDTLTRGFSHFVTSMTAPVASGWSGCRVGLAPTGKRRLSTAPTQSRRAASRYSITSSARSRIDGGTARPSALAVLAFKAISNFTGSCTGRSAG